MSFGRGRVTVHATGWSVAVSVGGQSMNGLSTSDWRTHNTHHRLTTSDARARNRTSRCYRAKGNRFIKFGSGADFIYGQWGSFIPDPARYGTDLVLRAVLCHAVPDPMWKNLTVGLILLIGRPTVTFPASFYDCLATTELLQVCRVDAKNLYSTNIVNSAH